MRDGWRVIMMMMMMMRYKTVGLLLKQSSLHHLLGAEEALQMADLEDATGEQHHRLGERVPHDLGVDLLTLISELHLASLHKNAHTHRRLVMERKRESSSCR